MVDQKEEITLRYQQYRFKAQMWVERDRIFLKYPYHAGLKDEIKVMEGAKWHGNDPVPLKLWSIKDSRRNHFQLDYLRERDPYAPYDAPLDAGWVPQTRFNHLTQKHTPLFKHQLQGSAHIYQRRQCIVAGEMGTAKTLMAMIAMERATQDFRATHGTDPQWWYVAPRSALAAVQREWRIWGGFTTPEWMTYEGLTKRMKEWVKGTPAPFGIILDEASRCKTPTAQRTQAAMAVAEGIREDWGSSGYVVLMSGTPAPNSPQDWWSLAEIACPGFLREGDIHKFKNRLGVIVQKESFDRGSYPTLVTWRDDEKKCQVCGRLANDPVHDEVASVLGGVYHPWQQSKNEIKLLYERLKGLVVVYLKRDCLDLPEKHFRRIEIEPMASVLRAASLIVKTAPSAIQGLTLLRELSDGFQYVDTQTGEIQCALCLGSGEIEQPHEVPHTCPHCPADGSSTCAQHTPQIIMGKDACPTCGGSGKVKRYERTVKEIPCPKDDVLIDLLEEHSDIGRIVIGAGFTGSIDRCVRICQSQGWSVIRMDQSAIRIMDDKGGIIHERDFLSMFQDQKDKYKKLAFVCHPKSGGMGLTLTASPTIIRFSNTFDAEAHIQFADRIHRPSMDLNRGATIIDLIHLPSDDRVLKNLEKKQNLQAMSMGDFAAIMDTEGERSI